MCSYIPFMIISNSKKDISLLEVGFVIFSLLGHARKLTHNSLTSRSSFWASFESKHQFSLSVSRPDKWVILDGYGSNFSSVRISFGSPIFGSGLGEVRVWVTFGSIMFGLDTGSVRMKFESCLFQVVYSNSVRIGYGSSLIQVRWDSVQCLRQYWIGYKSDRV